MAVALSADRPRKSANFLTCVLGLSRRIVMSSISRRRNGLMALSVIGAPVLGEVLAPQSQDRTLTSRYSPNSPLATNYRESGLVLRRVSPVAPNAKASDISSPPCLLRLLPAGANRRVGLAPTGKRRLVTARPRCRH